MPELDSYLQKYYLNAAQFAAACEIDLEELKNLIDAKLIPEPAYTVTETGMLKSHAFGEMPAPGSACGQFFHPEGVVWVSRVRHAFAQGSGVADERVNDRLKADFTHNFQTALRTLNQTVWRLTDSFTDEGAPINDGVRLRCETAWKYFLNGTFSLCVAHPVSEAAIAEKEVLQEKLSALSDNGLKPTFAQAEVAQLLALIDLYADAATPFSPLEYAISSRKRLVDDLRARILAR